MCKKTQCANELQALSIRGYTLQLYLDNFILGYAGLSFFNNKEKDGLHMNQTNVERFTFRTFLVQELVTRGFLWFQLEQDGHDDKQSFAQMRRAVSFREE